MLLFIHTPSVKNACRCGHIPFLVCNNVMENLRKEPGTCLFLIDKLTCFSIVILIMLGRKVTCGVSRLGKGSEKNIILKNKMFIHSFFIGVRLVILLGSNFGFALNKQQLNIFKSFQFKFFFLHEITPTFFVVYKMLSSPHLYLKWEEATT